MEAAMQKPRILVVYYSRSGTTRRIAEALSAALESSIEEVLETRDRTGAFGYWRSLVEARIKRAADILPARNDPSAFNLVVIGTPVWAWSVSSPIRAYLSANKQRLPDVAFFCTMGGRGSAAAFAQMQDIAGKAPLATCALTAEETAPGRRNLRLSAFIEALKR
jgi:flavodoxin